MFRRTWQSPSNAHAYRLYVVKEPCGIDSTWRLVLACLAAMSEALNYGRFYEVLSNLGVSTDLLRRCFRLPNQLRCSSAEPRILYQRSITGQLSGPHPSPASPASACAALCSAEPSTIARDEQVFQRRSKFRAAGEELPIGSIHWRPSMLRRASFGWIRLLGCSKSGLGTRSRPAATCLGRWRQTQAAGGSRGRRIIARSWQ